MAYGRTEDEIAKELGADGVYYSTMQDLTEALEGSTFCRACLNGEYAYPPPRPQSLAPDSMASNSLRAPHREVKKES